jgi:excisionase family DNA binding protein
MRTASGRYLIYALAGGAWSNTANESKSETPGRATPFFASARPVTVVLVPQLFSMNGGKVMNVNTQEIYRIVFRDYPDILDVKQVSALLGVSTKTVYRLLRNGAFESLKIGREFRVPKVSIMKYVKLFGSPLCEQSTS